MRNLFASMRAHTSRVRGSDRMRPRFDVLERIALLSGDPVDPSVLTLSTGNIVVTTETSPPAAYVYNGQTGALISTLTAASGMFTATALTNGNFVVIGNDTVTWGSGTTGVSGIVNAANSLVAPGSTPTVTPLNNGNYVVDFAGWENFTGAVTWGNGTTGTVGNVSSANSLIGSTPGDDVGSGGVTVLSNGNYIVDSAIWNNDEGAVTWANGETGITGTISAANSLVGWGESNAEISVTPLAKGNFVVSDPQWNASRGIVTWGSGTAGITGTVSAAGSLVGTNVGDGVGDQVVALTNGDFVVATNGACSATWGNGTTAITGTISASNSLLGGDLDGGTGNVQVTALTNGNYVVAFPNWEGPAGQSIALGAVTLANGSTGTTGSPSAANSLVGSDPGDQVGSGGVTALTNGNYVVTSPHWDKDEGAATWGNGSTGASGTVSAANSLIGSNQSQGSEEGDWVGNGGVTALANGNYLVLSYLWDRGTGAVTWANGASGTKGVVSSANSLVGTYPDAEGGGYSVTTLSNGNYLIDVPSWEGNAGAVTFGDAMTGVSGTISASNSLVGNDAGDETSSEYQVAALPNGNYAVVSVLMVETGASATRGAAITWCNGTTGTVGTVPTSNTFSEIPPSPQVTLDGLGVSALADSDYVLSVTLTKAPDTYTSFNGSNGNTRDGQDAPDPENTIDSQAFAFVATDGNEFALSDQGGGGVVLTALGAQSAQTQTMATSLSAVSGSGSPGGTATLTSTLTANGAPVAGRTIVFTLDRDDTTVTAGTAITDANGVATLSGVSLVGFSSGTYVSAVGAAFSGDSTYSSSTSTGTLFVDVVQGTPRPFIVSSEPLFTRKLNKRGKPTGDRIFNVVFDFSSALDPATATDTANYQVDAVTTHRVKKQIKSTLHPITGFKVDYRAADRSVTLTFARQETFSTGGQISVKSGPPSGIAGASGAELTGTTVFEIAPGGRSVSDQ